MVLIQTLSKEINSRYHRTPLELLEIFSMYAKRHNDIEKDVIDELEDWLEEDMQLLEYDPLEKI